MRCEIKIEMDNAAFDDGPATELARILSELAKCCADDFRLGVGFDQSVRDLNGNTVGRMRIMGETKAEKW